MRILTIVLGVGVAAAAYAQGQPAVVTEACKSVKNVVLPIDDTVGLGRSCSPDELYYGTKGRPNYRAARSCAWSEWKGLAHPLSDDLDGLVPTSTLAMIYANGRGVPRNVDLAIRLACVDDPPANDSLLFDELISALLKVKDNPYFHQDRAD